MELKRYQGRALERLGEWFGHLEVANNSPAAAWEMAGMERHVSRWDSAGRPIPHVCLKVPTGGGKTLLAAEAMVKCNRRTGLVLWAVPNKAIYAQTKRALWDRGHPYRAALDRASGRRVKVLEKEENLSLEDVENYLCVMLLSLQSANRRNNKEFLKMFQEAGRYSSFFPDIDDEQQSVLLLEEHPGLETAKDGRVLRTLANVFRICRPVIVLDEAHKSYGDSFDEAAFNQFDPTFILELSATPDGSKSNVLVDIGGQELKEEEMIKLPIHVTGHGDSSWRDVLREAADQLSELSEWAGLLEEDTGRYIRPMAVVRAERTGRSQRGQGFLHSEDVREFLVSSVGVPADQVRVQSSETRELDGEDLVSEECGVRWIITKDALKEGWDCSYAYILVLLDSTKAKTTVTQMMGRVLRQPHARLTGTDELDCCYVHCHNASVDQAVETVKRELQEEGFGDVVSHVRSDTGETTVVRVKRRDHITNEMASLPRVLHRSGGEIDYDQHILADIDWETIGPPDDWDLLAIPNGRGTQTVDVQEEGISTANKSLDDRQVNGEFDLAWHTRQLRDTIPNPWQAARIIHEAVASLKQEGHGPDWIAGRRPAFIRAIEQHAMAQIDEQAEKVFNRKMKSGEITFDLDLPFEYAEWYDLQAPSADPGVAYNRTLFSPAYNHDMNELEKRYAVILESNPAIKWWHRIAARRPGEYRLQGWRRDYVYPDFVALEVDGRIIAHETKGGHLQGSDDTRYKQRLLKCLEDQFNSRAVVTIHGQTATADFKLLFENDIP